MPTITCKIPHEINARLDRAARERHVPKSQSIREALAANFKRTKSRVSAFDLMKDACGLIKGAGPKTTPATPGI